MWNYIVSLSTSSKIFIGMVLGIICGLITGEAAGNLAFVGDMWMNGLKIAIAPTVLIMLILGIGRQQDMGRMGRVSAELLTYYVFTTFFAAVLGVVVASFTKAGIGFKLPDAPSNLETVELSAANFFSSMIPNNFLAPLVNSSMMQVLVLGVICGIVVAKMENNNIKETILKACDCLQEFFSGILRLMLVVAPIGIFCYMASISGTSGVSAIVSLGKFFVTMVTADIIHIVVVYGLIVMFLLQHKNPFVFWKNMIPSWVIAFTTASSVLCIPTNTAICNEKYRCDPAITNFGIPLGAVFNFDGATIFFPCVLLFAAQAAGIEYNLWTLLYMCLIGTVVASSGGGVFGGALVKLMIMCEIFTVPNSVITMVAGIFAILDMFITVVNTAGDVAGTTLVDYRDKKRKGISVKTCN